MSAELLKPRDLKYSLPSLYLFSASVLPKFLTAGEGQKMSNWRLHIADSRQHWTGRLLLLEPTLFQHCPNVRFLCSLLADRTEALQAT